MTMIGFIGAYRCRNKANPQKSQLTLAFYIKLP